MAADEAHKAADAEIEAFAREVRAVYGAAEDEARAKLEKHLRSFEKEDRRQREAVKAGELDEADYRKWRSLEMTRGKRYRSLLDDMAEGYARADEQAAAMIADRLPGVYAENYNFGTYQVESRALVDTSFALQDASTVAKLLREHGSYLPTPRVALSKDKAWARRMLANQVTKGVMLGEPIPDIARRVKKVTGSTTAASLRTARTAVTASESAGRVDSYRRAQGLGIALMQQWVATMDMRTRPSHRALDGVKVPVGGMFPNGCRYPGDPEATHGETANCRCTLVAAVEGVDYGSATRWSRLPKGMGYEDWKAGKPPARKPKAKKEKGKAKGKGDKKTEKGAAA